MTIVGHAVNHPSLAVAARKNHRSLTFVALFGRSLISQGGTARMNPRSLTRAARIDRLGSNLRWHLTPNTCLSPLAYLWSQLECKHSTAPSAARLVNVVYNRINHV